MAHTTAHDADPHVHQQGYLPGTDYALPHLSRFSRMHAGAGRGVRIKDKDDTDNDGTHHAALLRHVNCGYLSTPGVPPTLLALKQHAQSLCWLIGMLEPAAAESVEVGRGSMDEMDKLDDDAVLQAAAHAPAEDGRHRVDPFDWLADLATPYTNDDPDHHRPLCDLVNEVKARDELGGTTALHCPLQVHRAWAAAPYGEEEDMVDVDVDNDDTDDNDDLSEYYADTAASHRPYASHHNLLMHANMCLERLDHELGPTGGLLSIFPTVIDQGQPDQLGPKGQMDEEEQGRNSLLGQWLVFTQQLVGRMHELELAHANALTALRGEAEKPLETPASSSSSEPRSLASLGLASQDRWILSHAGKDVWSALHDQLDREGLRREARDVARREQGVCGAGMGQDSREGGASRLLHIDVSTRYYRVDDHSGKHTDSRGPLFVCPAWDYRPGTRAVAELEKQPTVVVVPWRGQGAEGDNTHENQRRPLASSLEHRYDARLRAAARTTRDNVHLRQQLQELRRTHERLLARVFLLEEEVAEQQEMS